MDAAGRSEADNVQIQAGSGSDLDAIEFRIQQLHNRRILLQKIKLFKRREEGESGWPTDQGEDNQSELETIQRDLKELGSKKEVLERQQKSSNVNKNRGQQRVFDTSETLYGGVYTLPPMMETPHPPEEESPAVDSLSQKPAVVRCPVCGDVGLTETKREAGEVAWMMCSLLAMLGCVAGCCLIPLLTESTKDVTHQCSHCHAHIHTHKPV